MTTAAVAQAWFLGVEIANLDTVEAAAVIAARDPALPFAYVVTPNAQHMVIVDRDSDPAFTRAYDAAWLRLCDSQIMRLLGRRLLDHDLPHAAGSDVTARLFAAHVRPDDAITVIGGDDELAARLRQRYGLTRLHLHQPPMGFIKNPEAVEACIRFVQDHPARYIFFAVGAPRSELLAHRILEQGGATGVGLCIGSSLHFITGLVPRAPLWMRRFALEWAYRLLRDPRNHARRVFVESLPLVGMALRARFTAPERRHLPRHRRG
jgi:N-acetylglucosaminyldiphosphoundecaprenol N-acetyl-beta-D-mannosaminyltransferase